MSNCPACDVRLRPGARSCKCGWSEDGKAAKALQYCACDYCRAELPYPRRSEPKTDKRIIGLSERGGFICKACYERGAERDWRSEAMRSFDQRHRGDMWGSLLEAARTVRSDDREAVSQFMAALKAQARKSGGVFGKLPYDPTQREAA